MRSPDLMSLQYPAGLAEDTPSLSKPMLLFEAPPISRRVGESILALVLVGFGGVFITFPLPHLFDMFFGNEPFMLGLAVAFLISTVMGGAVIFCAFAMRIWISPYRFAVDAAKMSCGYVWKDAWAQQVDLTGITALVTTPITAVIFGRGGFTRSSAMDTKN